ncbi:MAG: PLP-dependent aminotransferase family protein [Anaerolineae bacterium]|nr:PLP-dependent aminotransferase family protein [Anaerolineae bacterium]
MFTPLKRQGGRPLYLQVADQLRAKIENGELAPHTRLPASRVLAKKLGVNRITIVNAYTELEIEGLVVSRVGSGTFVAGGHNDLLPGSETPAASPWSGPLAPPRQWTASQMLAEMMRLARQPGVISFANGAPASEFLPVNEFRRALNDVLRQDGAMALQYEEAVGYQPLRETIAHYLHRQGTRVHSNNILITAGCQQALDMTLRVLARGDNSILLLEDPCYLGLLDLVTARRIQPIGISLDADGLQTDRLEQVILRYRPRLIYVTPTFHNPTGATMPLERRQALLDIATRYGVPILEDNTYEELRYEGEALPTLKSMDTADLVFLAGGFSKTLVPGIRIGYLAVPAYVRERLIAIKQTTDLLTSPLNQRALFAYLQSGHFSQHLNRVRTAYQERRDTMLAAVKQYFPAEARWRCPQGGMYLWVEMPSPGPTATDLYLTAINYNVAFAIGSVFSASGSFAHALRLSFVTHTPQEIQEGIRRLGKAWKELLARQAAAAAPAHYQPALHIL